MNICEICKDDGRCRNNTKSNDYDDIMSDYWDCVEFIEKTENLGVGSTMKSWIQKSNKSNKDYVSSFCKWSSKHSKTDSL